MSPISPISSLLPPESSSLSFSGPLGWFPTWIVGRRYYDAVPPPDAALPCERQPDNPSDPDAIAVYAPRGNQVGHLPRYDAAYLAPLLDRGAIRLTARLAADDDPHNRTAIRLEVWADEHAVTLAGPDAGTAEAVWHGQLIALWQNRARYTHQALDAFRSEIRDLAHSGRLWPETQLFYRLLKGTVADGEAAEEQARQLAARLAAEAEAIRLAAETANVRAAFACEACGPLLPFGHLSVLPLRALRPATIAPLTETLRTGAAALTLKKAANGASAFEVLLADDARVLAVGGERLDTTAGAFRIAKDTLIESADTPFTLHALADGDDAPNRRTPVFLSGAATVEPPLPALPPEATGFAVFRGGERLHLALFAHPACAVAALAGLRRLTWHLRPSRPAALSAESAFAALAPIFEAAPFSNDPPFVRFYTTPGLRGEARLSDGNALAYLRLAVNENEYSSLVVN